MGGAGGLKNDKKHEKLGKMKNRPFMTVYPVVVCCRRDSKNGHEGMIFGGFHQKRPTPKNDYRPK